jgi:phosphoglycolate phosphatase
MPLTPAADGAIFDFDGVIIDSLAPVETAMNGALREHGFAPRPAAELARFIGPPTTSAFAELTGFPEGSEQLAAIVATYHELFAGVYLEQTRLVDGIAEVLHGLTIPLALATAKERRFVGPLLERFGLRFEFVSAPELAEPKAQTVERARRALGASDPVVVGDRFYDIDAARANGLRVIAVTWGIGGGAELRGADIVVDLPEELATLLA